MYYAFNQEQKKRQIILQLMSFDGQPWSMVRPLSRCSLHGPVDPVWWGSPDHNTAASPILSAQPGR